MFDPHHWIAQCHRHLNAPLWWVALTVLPRWIYTLIVATRNCLYDLGWLHTVRLPVPVLSIGNLTTGGTGKTPVVIALARQFVEQGKAVVILSRGYGAREPRDYTRATNPTFGDEPYLIQQAVPEAVVIVGRNRKANALRAMADYHPDVMLLDDGFQYRGLGRTVDIVLVDAQARLGNGHLLPTGPLREPVASLSRAHLLCLTRWPEDSPPPDQLPWVNHLWLLAPHLQQRTHPVPIGPVGLRRWDCPTALLPLSLLARQEVVAVSGIAHPAQFEQVLLANGAVVRAHEVRADHHDYTAADVESLSQLLQQWPQAWLVTTGKDAVKLDPLTGDRLPAQRCMTLEIAPILDSWLLNSVDRPRA